MREKSKYAYNMYEAFTILLCAVAVIFLALGARNAVACGVALTCALIGAALGYVLRPMLGAVIMAASWLGLLTAELLSPDADGLSLAFMAVWTAAECALMTYHSKSMESERSRRHFSMAYNKRMMLLDEGTELRSLRAYMNDAELYMRIAGRHNLGLALITWELANADELRGRLSEAAFGKLMKSISNVLSKSIRTEDMVYILDDKQWLWGTLMLTDTAYLGVIRDRILPKLENAADCKPAFTVRWAIFDKASPISPLALMESVRGE